MSRWFCATARRSFALQYRFSKTSSVSFLRELPDVLGHGRSERVAGQRLEVATRADLHRTREIIVDSAATLIIMTTFQRKPIHRRDDNS